MHIFYDHLKKIGKQQKIDLFLYTRGGDLDSVWPLINLIKNFCAEFNVLIPYRAHSAGTLIALGANKIVMGKMAQLSPIDPSTQNLFNPSLDQNNLAAPKKPISVEDVIAYMSLVKDQFTLRGEGVLSEAFHTLAKEIHPLALGNVHRVYKQIRKLADSILQLRGIASQSKEERNKIIDTLTVEFYSHSHAINYAEATKLLGAQTESADEEMDNLLWNLLEAYYEEMKINSPFNLVEHMEGKTTDSMTVDTAIIESTVGLHKRVVKCKVSQMSRLPPGITIPLQLGQQIPLIPGLPTNINLDLIKTDWVTTNLEAYETSPVQPVVSTALPVPPIEPIVAGL
ncbi:MAG: hypothetical protein WCT53_04325 [Candidatus Gracilibacteria bacterium]